MTITILSVIIKNLSGIPNFKFFENDLIERSCFNYVPTITNNVIVFEDRIIICLYQLISAVDFLHQNGIIHKRIGKGYS